MAAAATVLCAVGVLSGGSGAVAADDVASGPVLAFAGYARGQQALLALDTGSGRQWTIATGFAQDPSWSPDGSRIAWLAYDDTDYLGHVQVATARGQDVVQVDGDGDSRALTWGSDGTLAWFHRSTWNPTDCSTNDRLVRPEIVLQAPDGSRRLLGAVAPTANGLEFSPDGRTLAWYEQGADPCAPSTSRLVLADVATGTQTVVAEGTYGLAFSPDSSTLVASRTTSDFSDAVLVDVAGRTSHEVATPGAQLRHPQFVQDGSALAVQRTVGTEDRFAVVGLDGALLRDLGPTPDLVEDVVASTDATSLLVAGSTVTPIESDVGEASPGIWRQPLDGSPATRLSGDGWLGSGQLAVAAWSSPAPVVPRHARHPR